MKISNKVAVIIKFALLIGLVIISSLFSTMFWSEKSEKGHELSSLIISKDITVKEFGIKNNLSNQILEKVFKIDSDKNLQQKVSNFNFNQKDLLFEVNRYLAIESESASKNWIKIAIKFILWIAFIFAVYLVIRKKKLSTKVRNSIYLASVIIFGVILGSDPSPMGTIKDAVVLFATKGAIFPPRLIALSAFLIMVIVFNKSICAWGCQLGTLQDLIFRINRKNKSKPIFKQYKIPFAFSNSIRSIFFILLSIIAFVWALDIVEFIDPFKVFKPSVISIIGWIFIGLILIFSLFVYRPWCTLFCPFGLFGWFFEKLSIFKIRVDYSKCIACDACVKSCPSTVMDSILKRKTTISDCFSCGSCIEVCPTDAIGFSSIKRDLPPNDKFKGKLMDVN
ncbi:MAG TPA: 4Fe-4S binding protein [Williamwhitmania sp.]|nr:4Fe-4S binding protein [Williamwhitmania sp.]